MFEDTGLYMYSQMRILVVFQKSCIYYVPSRPRRPRVRGCFQVEVVSFSRRIVFSRIPFVSCLYSIVCSIRKHEEYSEDTIYKIRLDTCVVSSILQYGVDTIRYTVGRIRSRIRARAYSIQHTVRIPLKAQAAAENEAFRSKKP